MPDTVMLHPHDEKLDALLLAEALYEGTPHLQNLAEKLARQHGQAQALPPFMLLGESLKNYWVLLAEEMIAHAEQWLPNQGSACVLSSEERDRINALPTHPLIEQARQQRKVSASPPAITTKRKKDGPFFTRRFKFQPKQSSPSVCKIRSFSNSIARYHFAFGWCFAPADYANYDVVEISLEADEIKWRNPDGIPMKSTRPSIEKRHVISCETWELCQSMEMANSRYRSRIDAMDVQITFWENGQKFSTYA